MNISKVASFSLGAATVVGVVLTPVFAAEIDVSTLITFVEAERATIITVGAVVLTIPVLGMILRSIGSVFHRA